MKGSIRPSGPADLPAINHLIESAIMAWPLAARVKRLSLPVLKYDRVDMETLQMLVFVRAGERGCRRDRTIAGVAAWGEDPAAGRQALLHGLYVDPDLQGQGIGWALQQAVFTAARDAGMEAVTVRAERVSVGYFEKCGYEALPPSSEPGNGYPYRFRRPLTAAQATGKPGSDHRPQLEKAS